MPLRAEALAVAMAMPQLTTGDTLRRWAAEVPGKVCGPGGSRVVVELERLHEAHGIEHVVLLGFCGGLDPALKAGSIVRPRVVVDVHRRGFAMGGIVPRAIQADDVGPSILSCEAVVTTPQEKSRLHRVTGAVAVDTESFWLAQAAQRLGIRLTVVRAVSDGADFALPDAISTWVDDQGVTRLARVMGFLARHPWKIPALIRLGIHSRRAGRSLAAAMVEDMKSWLQ